ncbi:hypothetical protein F383_16553 [Gossypium arboreum]|uniref:Uncharacterized protein n=1 Tax=Gossypium arboreum TaxID=29729 RepID=A0A0B0NPX2_GOSAR|nr:hypothetical protein F383_16553 [Gossypium arboreum]
MSMNGKLQARNDRVTTFIKMRLHVRPCLGHWHCIVFTCKNMSGTLASLYDFV